MNLLTWLAAWLDARLDKRMSLDGDLMTPDWHDGDGDPVLQPELPATETIAEFVARVSGGTVHVDYITPILPPVATYPVKVRVLTPAQHVERLKERKV